MGPEKRSFGAIAISSAAACLIALTWIGALSAIEAHRQERMARVSATLTNHALMFSEQISRQIQALDQTLGVVATTWESSGGTLEQYPCTLTHEHCSNSLSERAIHGLGDSTKTDRALDLQAWRQQAVVQSGLSRDVIRTDEHGIIRQSSVAEAVNQDVSAQDAFRGLTAQPEATGGVFMGPGGATAGPGRWQVHVARALHHLDGSFAGMIDAEYRVPEVADGFGPAELGPGGFVGIVGLSNGQFRSTPGSPAVDLDADLAHTPMFEAIRGGGGVWLGASPPDGVTRIDAFRPIAGRGLAVVVAMTERQALAPAAMWRQKALLFAGCMTSLVAGMALLLVRRIYLLRGRALASARDQVVLASANAQLEAARALAAAKAEQLEATLAGMTDGVSMFDAQTCLVAWNARFPEVAGVPSEILRVGLPMQDVLRGQIMTGQFGQIDDPEQEIARRMARLRSPASGLVQRQRPDGHTVELRRKPLPEGGFVTLYADITEHKRAEAALREARASAEGATAAKSRFVATVSHEIRTPLNVLLHTLRQLDDTLLPPAQRSLLVTARQSGAALSSLINDILEMSKIEAGKLAIRPSLFDVRKLLQGLAEMFERQAAERGTTLRVAVAEATPPSLLADAGRLRQVLVNFLANALRHSAAGELWLAAEPGRHGIDAVRLLVKDRGPVIAAEARGDLFRPFSQLERTEGEDRLAIDALANDPVANDPVANDPVANDPVATGLGLSICLHLTTLMGGDIGCEPWMADGQPRGNVFWVSLPVSALPVGSLPIGPSVEPAPAGLAPSLAALPNRNLPRTRILLVEDVPANQIVTATLLRREGHLVDVASSGRAAIRAVQRETYDVIFMDIFMPSMGGEEATRIIRSLAEPVRSVPIVALTANASAEDKARFTAAGMQDILDKPTTGLDLLEALRTHVWHGHPTGGRGVGVGRSDDPSRVGAIDAAILAVERVRELRANLLPRTFGMLIEECLADLDQRLPALRQALAANLTDVITAQSHAIVGMAAGYGMASLETTLRGIMAAARSGHTDALGADAIARVEFDVAAATRAWREILSRR